ncbi:MAG: hypothetical protein A3F12_04795 [Gammaproteobacteria bacterium RIFCSPHIGHO2_12_FULL_38_14]|nr:MAG: hypothetical protein A3F12_04795 [Gammaproteobacteria bacterium RIFCSPHIGHO2_12_FULL_38_14]
MQKTKHILLISCLIFLSGVVFANPSPTQNKLSPVGYWKTIDDISGKPKAIVQIWKSSDQKLYGKVVQLFNRDPHVRCKTCVGEKQNQPIVGMTILNHFKPDQNQVATWNGGSILDPKNGKVYHSTMRVLSNGKQLSVRGYIGIPLFGRSQVWERVNLAALS